MVPNFCFAQVPDGWTTHIVISEVQIAGVSATDEFVELYNPTDKPINIAGWRLSRKTASGNLSNLLTSFPDVSIPEYSFFLIVHPSGYKGAVLGDATYSTGSSIASDNTLILFSDAGQTIVDKVGLGSALDKEGTATANPSALQSVERKPGLNDSLRGNGVDSDNNFDDFLLRETAEPQNLASTAENPNVQQNNAPTLSYTGESGYETSGVTPEGGYLTDNFVYKVKYTDLDNDAPKAGFPKVWIDVNQDGITDGNEMFLMSEEDLLDTNYADGKIYEYEESFTEAGENYQYKFLAQDSNGAEATGEATAAKQGPQISTENQAPSVELLGISAGETYDSSINLGWTISDDSVQAHSISLYWSNLTNGTDWINLFENKSDIFEYNWDISSLPTGDNYQIKIKVCDSGAPIKCTEIISNSFSIQNIKVGDLAINELEYDSAQSGIDSDYEWVEIYNSLSYDVTLVDWQICDNSSCNIFPQAIIPANGYLVIAATKLGFLGNFGNFGENIVYLEDSVGNGLANSGDSVILKDNIGKIISAISYSGASQPGFSWARSSENEWSFTSQKTPGEENIFDEEKGGQGGGDETPTPTEEINVTDLENVRSFPAGALVSLEGIVSVEPGSLGGQIIYIQGSQGVQVFLNSGDFPELVAGDMVRVVGEISDYFGETRIKARTRADFSIISSGNMVEVREIREFGEIGEELEGHLVYVVGQYVKKDGGSIYISDGLNQVRIYLKDSTGIILSGLTKNDTIEVRGIVSQTEAGYRILPRSQSDIKVTKVANVTKVTNVKKASVKKATVTKTKKTTPVIQKDFSEVAGGSSGAVDWKTFLLIGGLMLGIFGAWWFFFREKDKMNHE